MNSLLSEQLEKFNTAIQPFSCHGNKSKQEICRKQEFKSIQYWQQVLLISIKMSRLMTKPTKWHVRPAKIQISLGIRRVWSVFPVGMKKAWVLSYPLNVERRLWSDWADALADLSLRWMYSHFVGFVTRRLKWCMACLNKVVVEIVVKSSVIIKTTWHCISIKHLQKANLIYFWHTVKHILTFYIFRNIFGLVQLHCPRDIHRTRQVVKIVFWRTFQEISSHANFGHLVFDTNIVKLL